MPFKLEDLRTEVRIPSIHIKKLVKHVSILWVRNKGLLGAHWLARKPKQCF